MSNSLGRVFLMYSTLEGSLDQTQLVQAYKDPERYIVSEDAPVEASDDVPCQERHDIDIATALTSSAPEIGDERENQLYVQQAAPLANQAQVLQDLCVIPIRKWRGNLPTSLGQLSREAQELYASG
ncbi:hypothetical protein GLOTRDRAFT_133892 [Gloeophyllum trabeum ATCC 11539]|uniref:Uncharacterized protein n=1 Tax=Gloeophyllum trabeum (strain ATCC 11539 / FP-39264 / Madison 617) TaxID=670483 RepID=S7RDM4_GLOTA|nr:uncharacterized protein GLOTRDRAFT_133892 [Gloeophyllum trabeum ATCC 11539]EPQ50524.1 hypothetical protein GLOTRDRAFT_133892 [Gloeophyllum trabeum ATCC 11539]